ncbi:MAG: hypothetical protein HY820_12385 [Acidobacteria bacterium]|nr:hypothetical protein [Acidobacteriota bacterium]
MQDRGKEFWEEEQEETRRDVHNATLKLVAIFAAILLALGFMLWRSQEAIGFAASHISGQADSRYIVTGKVKSAKTGQPVPWPALHDEYDGKTYSDTTGKHDGTFVLSTIATAHHLRVSAFGYKPATVRIGKPWFTWLPSGSEKLEIVLQPE